MAVPYCAGGEKSPESAHTRKDSQKGKGKSINALYVDCNSGFTSLWEKRETSKDFSARNRKRQESGGKGRPKTGATACCEGDWVIPLCTITLRGGETSMETLRIAETRCRYFRSGFKARGLKVPK